jgi:class 3 adenylate cyclase
MTRVATGLGLRIRAGVHTGEIELVGDDIRGIAVHSAARVLALAGPGEVLVSAPTVALIEGSGLVFEDAGSHWFKCLSGERPVLRLVAARPG